MKVIDVPLDKIHIGERRREDLGDIAALAKGMDRVGLLEPIIVDRNGEKDHYRLIAGGRRLKAAALLKWSTIPASFRDHLTDAEMRDIELEENENRKALTEGERTRSFRSSKRLVEKAKEAAEVLSTANKTPNPKGGRPTKGDASQESVAEALGVSRGTVANAEQHVDTAERFPFMQGSAWRQSDVLRVRERLDEMADADIQQTVSVLGCAKLLDPELTVNLIDNMRAKTPTERAELFRLSQSEDPRDRSLALTEAAKLPPMPDPRLGILDNALGILNAAIKPYPNDPLTPKLLAVRSELRTIRAAVKEVSYDARREQLQKGARLQ